ncbi:alpha/beta fold hydrolase [Aquimarina agarilytica]|uniref:alpha/beta fold hydrolase n=1 Tax=Aquimarina agarilytica TaxID=1087449 RepID=UPI000287D080|nr:alpha/beta hydrolase [Aquimarina agarilytica]
MNKLALYSILFVLSLISCKPYQVETKPNDMSYSEFTKAQKKWDSPDGTIAFIDKGKGQPLLLLHGIPTSGWLYRKMIDPLVAQGYRVIVPDMLGFGNSEHPKGYDIYDKTQHAKRILGLMEHLGINNWSHVMHDAGGLWTWEMLKIAPNKLSHLTILNTIIYKDGFCPPLKIKKGMIGKIAMWGYRTKTNMMIKKLFKSGTNNHPMSKAEIEGYTTPLKKGKTDALYKFFTTNTKAIPDYSTVLKSLNIPTQVIWGTDDEILLWKTQNKQVITDLNIKESNIHLLPKNHFLQEEATESLLNFIGQFSK